MRFKLAALAALGALVALPASAQSYYDRGCRERGRDNQVAGAVVGSIIGGVLGSNLAGRGHRSDGTLAGAVVGGLAGSAIGADGRRRCEPVYAQDYPPPHGPAYDYGRPDYGSPAYEDPRRYDYSSRGRRMYQDEPYTSGDFRADSGNMAPHYPGSRVDERRYGDYKRSNNDLRECVTVDSEIEMPDGSVVTRPVEACREASYGDWILRD